MLYTPLLPEAASGTLEPRHVVVPLREMCPHAELAPRPRRRATIASGESVVVETLAGTARDRLRAARRRARGDDARAPRARARRARARLQGPRRRDRPPQPRPAAARARRRSTPSDPRRARASSSSAPATRASRRSRSSPTSSQRRAPLLPGAARRAAALGARRRGAEDPPGDPAQARRVRGAAARAARRRDPRRHDARVVRRPRGRALERRRGSRRARSSGRPACARARCCRELGAPARRARPRHGRRDAARRGLTTHVWALGDCAAVPEHEDAGRRRPADLPARAPPGAPAREEPHRRRRSRTATGCSARWRRSAATRGSPRCPGLRLCGFPGWFVTRTYHLYQLPLLSRKLRVVADWTTSRSSSAATSSSSRCSAIRREARRRS